MRSLSGVTETFGNASGDFLAFSDAEYFSARRKNREEHFQLAIHTATIGLVLVMLVAGLALCYVEINILNLKAISTMHTARKLGPHAHTKHLNPGPRQ